MINSSQLQLLTKKAISDDSFRAKARKDPKAALTGLGIQVPAGLALKVHENTRNEIHVVLPEKGDAKALAAIDPNVAKVFEKAWSDPKFKAQLLQDAPAAIKAATGAKLPKSLKIVVHEDAEGVENFVLPYVQPKGGELSDADLELVAGGKGGGCDEALATQGSIVTVAGGAAVATGGTAGGVLGIVAVGTMFSSFITLGVSAAK